MPSSSAVPPRNRSKMARPRATTSEGTSLTTTDHSRPPAPAQALRVPRGTEARRRGGCSPWNMRTQVTEQERPARSSPTQARAPWAAERQRSRRQHTQQNCVAQKTREGAPPPGRRRLRGAKRRTSRGGCRGPRPDSQTRTEASGPTQQPAEEPQQPAQPRDDSTRTRAHRPATTPPSTRPRTDKPVRRPASRCARRLRHQQPPTSRPGSQHRTPPSRQARRSSEPSRRRSRRGTQDPTPAPRPGRGPRRPARRDRGRPGPARGSRTRRSCESSSTPCGLRPRQGQDQPGHAAAGAQVEEPGRRGSRRPRKASACSTWSATGPGRGSPGRGTARGPRAARSPPEARLSRRGG